MTTVVINENTEVGRSLITLIRALQKSTDAIVCIFDEDETGNPFIVRDPAVVYQTGIQPETYDRIPGLPYTDEERIASIHQSEEDIRAGHTVTMEEMRDKHPRI